MNSLAAAVVKRFSEEATSLMLGPKDHDYNNIKAQVDLHDNFPYDWMSAETFINKHLTRLKGFMMTDETPKNESIVENFKDVYNYIALAFTDYAVKKYCKEKGIAVESLRNGVKPEVVQDALKSIFGEINAKK